MASTPQTRAPSRGEDGPRVGENLGAAGRHGHFRTMAWLSLPLLAVLAGVHVQWLLNPAAVVVQAQTVPAQAQIVDQRTFNGVYPCLSFEFMTCIDGHVTKSNSFPTVWPTVVPPSTVVNGTQVFMPPGIAAADLLAKPFHIYNDEFYSIIGDNPTLTIIAETETDPLFHEAVVW